MVNKTPKPSISDAPPDMATVPQMPVEAIDWDSVSRFKQPEDSLGYLLWQTAHGWMRRLNSSLLEAGMTHLQYIVLGSTLWLTRTAKPPSQARLAEFCAMDPMLISKVVRALERKHAIRRAPDPRDTRSKLLNLTDEGVAIILRCIPLVESAYEEYFTPVGGDEAQFHATLMRLFHAMKHDEGQ